MQFTLERINEVIQAKIGATKKVVGPITHVRLNATALNAMTSADANYIWYGKVVCVGASADVDLSYNSTIEFTTSGGVVAIGYVSGTFYDVLFNKVTGTAVLGEFYFVGIKQAIENV
tara:strand:+ start:9362 stop:9712 length:351 start_codon:yes stop_codon:yes gene_type:complete